MGVLGRPDGLQKGREREGHRYHPLHDRRPAIAAGLGPQVLEQGAEVGAGISITSRVSGLQWKYQRRAEGRPMYRRLVQKTTCLPRTEGLLPRLPGHGISFPLMCRAAA